MVEKLGRFGATLFVGSGLLAAWVGLHMVFAHPLGVCGAAMLFLAWAAFARLLVFVFTTEAPLKEYRGEEVEGTKTPVPLPPEIFAQEKPAGRILPEAVNATTAASRILGGQEPEPPRTRLRVTQDPPESEEAAERREDAAWAEMFRAL